jgi:hypothetical protein
MISYFRATTRTENGITLPDCSLLGRQQLVAYSQDRTEAGIMVDATTEQKQAIIDSGGVISTRQGLADIYAFPASFPPTIPPMAP